MVLFGLGVTLGALAGFFGYCAFDNWLSAWPA